MENNLKNIEQTELDMRKSADASLKLWGMVFTAMTVIFLLILGFGIFKFLK